MSAGDCDQSALAVCTGDAVRHSERHVIRQLIRVGDKVTLSSERGVITKTVDRHPSIHSM